MYQSDFICITLVDRIMFFIYLFISFISKYGWNRIQDRRYVCFVEFQDSSTVAVINYQESVQSYVVQCHKDV